VSAAGAREAAQWNLFADWCLAEGEQPLPAAPLTLARFLTAHPAASGTQRRRVGVINAVHRRGGYVPPGDAEAVRDLLDLNRRERRRRRARAAAASISRLPENGWPTALFARRDAMMLVLAAAGLPATEIATLRLGGVRMTGNGELLEVTVTGETLTTGTDLVREGVSPAAVWRQWESVRRVQHRLPSTRLVAQLLDGQPVPRISPAPAELPLFTPLDRWGAAPLRPEPLSAAAIAGITSAHLEGSRPAHRPLRKTASATIPEPVVEPEPLEPVVLDPDSFSRGLNARRLAAQRLDGISDALDDVEARADALLAGLLELLEEPELRRSG
jgi:hypothetical protein